MDMLDLFQRLALALAIGLLVGIERGWQDREEAEGERTGGVRTFALTGLLGGVWAAIVAGGGPGGLIALALVLTVFSGLFGLYRYRETSHEHSFGATTVVAAMLVFSLGAYAVVGDERVAAAAGVATAALLALKGAIHGFLRALTPQEIRASLTLLAMSVILLPVLPDRTVDPLDVINPREIWLLTVMIAAVSFAGYVAIRATGERAGLILSGIAGGIVSSTVTTITLARLVRQEPGWLRLALAGVALAGATMMLRVLVIVFLINPALATSLALPLAGAALAQAGAGLLAARRDLSSGARKPAALDLKSPIDFETVFRFGALLALVMLASKAVSEMLGETGLYGLAAVSGLADVDAISLSMARLGGSDVALRVAGPVVLTAVGVNTLAKAAFAWVSGGRALGLKAGLVALLAIAAGALGLAVSLMIG
ncbi:MAG: DUF4010 domain-containing protein [Hyphomicrobiaceae bacterium]